MADPRKITPEKTQTPWYSLVCLILLQTFFGIFYFGDGRKIQALMYNCVCSNNNIFLL